MIKLWSMAVLCAIALHMSRLLLLRWMNPVPEHNVTLVRFRSTCTWWKWTMYTGLRHVLVHLGIYAIGRMGPWIRQKAIKVSKSKILAWIWFSGHYHFLLSGKGCMYRIVPKLSQLVSFDLPRWYHGCTLSNAIIFRSLLIFFQSRAPWDNLSRMS